MKGEQGQVGTRAAVRVLRLWFEALAVAGDRYRDQSHGDFAAGGAEGMEYRLYERGGFWNDTGGRAYAGITKADVSGCRRDLRKLANVVLKWDDVDAILNEAVLTNGISLDELERVACHPTWNKVKGRNRLRARAAGKCGICTVRPPTPGTKPNGTPWKTCAPCRATVIESKRRREMREDLARGGGDVDDGPDLFDETG